MAVLFASWTYDATKATFTPKCHVAHRMPRGTPVEQGVRGIRHTSGCYAVYYVLQMDYIRLIQSHADLTEYRPNPEFFLENFYSEAKEQHDPCCSEPFSTHMGFLLPADCGEKISLAMSCLVAMMVFLMKVILDIPPSSTLPLIGRYYFASIVILGSNLIICVISLKFRHDSRSLSHRTRWIIQNLGRICFLTPPKSIETSADATVTKSQPGRDWKEKSEQESMLEKNENYFGNSSQEIPQEGEDEPHETLYSSNNYEARILEALEQIQSTMQRTVYREQAPSSQSSDALYFCKVLDRIFFIILVLCTISFNLELLLSSPHSYSFEYCPKGRGNCPPDWNYALYEKLIESGQGLSNMDHNAYANQQ
ncbi:Neuronal acetylcholine receptor subunit beta-4 [Halocaridina rubra]|uniref:Neuronal acetylcholine receptor subunit beta-4 n=1 Tax=Halocaridina rubra TaxID=373956 RepID=A0AAN9A888_HALRR